MAAIDDLIASIQMENVLDGQREHVEEIVRGIRPLTILDPRAALLKLLETFVSDGGERAATVAAFAVLALAEARTRIEALESPWPTKQQIVDLADLAMGHHDFNSDSCHPRPGAECWDWCAACKALDGLPSYVVDAANAQRTERES